MGFVRDAQEETAISDFFLFFDSSLIHVSRMFIAFGETMESQKNVGGRGGAPSHHRLQALMTEVKRIGNVLSRTKTKKT